MNKNLCHDIVLKGKSNEIYPDVSASNYNGIITMDKCILPAELEDCGTTGD